MSQCMTFAEFSEAMSLCQKQNEQAVCRVQGSGSGFRVSFRVEGFGVTVRVGDVELWVPPLKNLVSSSKERERNPRNRIPEPGYS